MASSFMMRFLDHARRRTTVGRTSLDEWSARRRDLYLTTHNTHNRQTSMPLAGFEHTISAGERPQIYALDRAATGNGTIPDHTFQSNFLTSLHRAVTCTVVQILRTEGYSKDKSTWLRAELQLQAAHCTVPSYRNSVKLHSVLRTA